ncbi:uncharacterized protein LOC120979380 [Bufo bufo]|uniref:uncharacterized protein LOC120979380 n=1 Tax=Bufo bufo TaxID=8384 RepID=UPI001ABE1901|nr:uncharacterized protein LOC120979380 [Bufo bufo]
MVGSLPGPAVSGAVCPAAPSTSPVARVEAPHKDRLSRSTGGILRLSSHPEEILGDPGDIEDNPVPDAPTVRPLPHFNSLNACVGGRLRLFSQAWSRITSDQWVLSTVRGFHIELTSFPLSISLPHPVVLSEQNRVLVDSELSDLVRKGAVEPAPGPPYGVISNIFLVAKKGGQMRPVINLRALNAFVVYRHFKMEGIHLLRDLLQMGDWMVKLDLKDAYLTVPVEDVSRNLLCFSWQGSVWRFTCLPFGLSSAPWCFTKLMRPAMAWLRSRGVRLIIYLDDILIMAQDRSVLLDHLRWTMDLLSELGFLLNREKSCLSPSREMEFLGFMVDSTAGTLSLPSAKIRSIRKELLRARSSPRIPLRQLARIIGLLASSIQAVFPAPLHYRALQRLKIAHLRKGASYVDWIPLDEETREELSWWIHNLHAWNGKAIFGQRPDFVVDSDASLSGWGAHCEGITTGGGWSEIETGFHINALELLAGSFAIKSFTRDTARSCIQLRMDNVSAVRYINGMGGTRSTILSRLAKDFWDYCLFKELVVLAEYLPGVHNIHADWSSRHLSDSSDWQLDPEHATGTILQLAPGSGSRGRGCIPPRLVQRDPLCVPAVPTDSADPHSSAPVCRGTDLAGPVLELPIMVPPPSGDDGRDPSPSPDVADSPPRPSPPATSSSPGRDTAPAGVSDFRGPWEVPGVSGTAKVLLENAWAPGTRRSYRSAWGFWADWCLARDLDPISAPVTEILHFLSSLFDQGKAYRTISLFRSAISASHQGFDGTPAGQHPLVCRLMRGSRMSRPPRPRFTTTWDMSRVLSFLSAWPQNSELSLRQLSAKLVTLLCLISCKRVSDVRALDHDARSYTPEGVTFDISRRTKTHIRSVSYPVFPASPSLCPVACLKEYEVRTSPYRSRELPQLFLSTIRPFAPVTTPTLARWMKWIMELSGVDVSLFSAHSARGASATSLAVSGARLEDILKLADWSSVSTFREFYFRPSPHVFSSIIDNVS